MFAIERLVMPLLMTQFVRQPDCTDDEAIDEIVQISIDGSGRDSGRDLGGAAPPYLNVEDEWPYAIPGS